MLLELDWTQFKAILDKPENIHLPFIVIPNPANDYEVFTSLDGMQIKCFLKEGGAEKTEFVSDYEAMANKHKGKKNNDGLPKIQPDKSYSDSSKSFTTPDYSNRSTWWWDTVQVTGETLADSGDGLTFNTSRSEYQSGWGASAPRWACC